MLLYLVRHGEAKSEEEDPERHLTGRGVEEAGKVAAFLKPLGIGVGAVWHSGKARAMQTAEIMASALAVKEAVMKKSGLSPLDPPGPIQKELARREEDLMIVGHLPFLGKLASALLAGNEKAEAITFEQSSVACLERTLEKSWTVKWVIAPGILP
jgi:phosphohistidine phosphatase